MACFYSPRQIILLSCIKINLFYKDFITAQHIIQIPATESSNVHGKYMIKLRKEIFTKINN
jgi:hypothetical protein